MLDLVDLFPKTIAVTELNSLTPELIERAIEYIDLCSNTDLGSDGAYTQEQQLLNKVMFREIKQEIIALCKEFSQVYAHEVEDIGICNSWGNVVTYGESIRYHQHSNSYISGAFYLTEGSKLSILNTFYDKSLFGFVPTVKKTADNFRSWKTFSVPPQPGRIILFPSGLYHCVLSSESREKRYSIAFNAIPLGRLGEPTMQINIQMP